MAFTSLGALVATCAALPVAGIKKQVAYRPRLISAADLPLQYARLPSSERALSTLTYGQGLRRAILEIVVLVEMLTLDTQQATDSLTVTIMDNLAATLEANALLLGMDNYALAPEVDTIGDGTRPVQAIVATIEVSG